MCDYSLEHYKSRPAAKDEQLVTQRFTSGSIGFAAPGDANTAVCIQCDMKLALSNVPATLQTRLGVSADEVVTFSRLDAGLYRDGVRFENDKQVSLQDLGPGVTAILVDDLQGGKTAKAALVAAE